MFFFLENSKKFLRYEEYIEIVQKHYPSLFQLKSTKQTKNQIALRNYIKHLFPNQGIEEFSAVCQNLIFC